MGQPDAHDVVVIPLRPGVHYDGRADFGGSAYAAGVDDRFHAVGISSSGPLRLCISSQTPPRYGPPWKISAW